MGKKTLEEIGKILLVSMISILVTFLGTRRVLLDSKLDKSVYYRDQEIHLQKDILDKKELKDHFDTRIDDLKEFMIELDKKDRSE